jgi:bacillolysin
MKKIITKSFLLLFAMNGFAQNPSKINIDKPKDRYADWVEFNASNAPAFRNNQVFLIDEKNKSSFSTDTKLITKETDQLGFTNYRYQQTIGNIPVEHAVYIAHVRNSRLLMQNGKWLMHLPDGLPTTASISESAALHSALNYIGATTYKWQQADEEAFIKTENNNPNATYFPKGTLVYYSGEEDLTSANLRLAYKFDVYAAEPLSRKIIYVDAVNGNVLGTKDLIHETNAAGSAVTAYSGTQAITTDLNAGTYRLREIGRGNGIQTFNMKKGTNYATAVDFTDADNVWNNVNTTKDQYATDAHWGAEKTYDFYKNNFNRNSIDGNGFLIKSYVHYSSNYFNAFWDGSRMTYGDGSSTDNNKPLTAIDVCGHEITHGLTTFSANLTYSGESGAMNEGFSDIFGTAIEWYARPTQHDWLIGADFYTIRSMSNPNAYSQPDTYLGTSWYTGTADNGGVHTNSGVLNYWFYLLCNGGSGTNDKGFVFNVASIGMSKAQAIAFRTLTVYLVSTSKYINARTASIQAATDLYGAASNEVTQVTNAWNAVGVGGGTAPLIAGPVTAKNTYDIVMDMPAISVFPNPVSKTLHLQMNNAVVSAKSFQMIDVNGKVVFSKNIATAKGFNNFDFDISGLQTGTYFVRWGREKIATIVKE